MFIARRELAAATNNWSGAISPLSLQGQPSLTNAKGQNVSGPQQIDVARITPPLLAMGAPDGQRFLLSLHVQP